MKLQSLARQRRALADLLSAFVAQQPDRTKGARERRAARAFDYGVRQLRTYTARPKARETWPQMVERVPGMMSRQNLADFAVASGCSVDHILSGEGEGMPIAATLAAHLERQLESDPVWQSFVQRFEITVDGERAITFLVNELREIGAEILEHRGETDTALQVLDDMAKGARDPNAAHRQHRKLKLHIANFAPSPAEARAAQLFDWSPGVLGAVAGPDGIRTDRLGGKRRKPLAADSPDAA